jgi:hypothetical protein
MIHRLGVCSDTHGYAAPAFDPASVSAILHGGDLYDAAADVEGLEPDQIHCKRGWPAV